MLRIIWRANCMENSNDESIIIHNQNTLRVAKLLASNNVYVFPVTRSKVPFKGSHGHEDATIREDEIEELWKRYGGDETNPRVVNIGVATGKSGLVVLDFDNRRGESDLQTGMEILKLIEERMPHAVAGALRQRTGSGGEHLIYRMPDGLVIKNSSSRMPFMPHVDTRGEGGYIVVAPSVGESGEYKWLTETTLENTSVDQVPVLPEYWINELRKYKLVKDVSDSTFKKDYIPPSNYTLADVRYTANYFLEKYVSEYGMGGKRHRGGELLAKQLLLLVHRARPGLSEAEAIEIMRKYAASVSQEYKRPNGKMDVYREEEAINTYRTMRPADEEPIIILSSRNVEEESQPVPQNITDEAMRILKEGDPVGYFVETFNMRHAGDEKVALAGLVCYASQCVLETGGLQLLVTGRSQSGKTHAAKTIVDMAVPEYVYAGTMSNKFLHYLAEGGKLRTGTAIFMDDKASLNPEIEEMMKTATSRYTERIRHGTVLEKRAKQLFLPARLFWVMTSADADFSEEVYNRFIPVGADDSEAQSERVNMMQRKKHRRGLSKTSETERFEVCREILRIMKKSGPIADPQTQDHNYFPVAIPYIDLLSWDKSAARRHNLFDVFCDVIKSLAVIRFMQRPRLSDGTIIATLEDLDDAMLLWYEIGGSLETHLTPEEDRVTQVIKAKGRIKQSELQEVYNHTYPNHPLSQSRISKLLNGRKIGGDEQVGGILDKVPYIHAEKCIDDVITPDGATRRNVTYYVWDPLHANTRYLDKRHMVSLSVRHVAQAIIEAIKLLQNNANFEFTDKRLEPHIKAIARGFVDSNKKSEEEMEHSIEVLCNMLGVNRLVETMSQAQTETPKKPQKKQDHERAGDAQDKTKTEEQNDTPLGGLIDGPTFTSIVPYDPKASLETRIMALRTLLLKEERWILTAKKPSGGPIDMANTLANRVHARGLYRGEPEYSGQLLKDCQKLFSQRGGDEKT